MFINEHIPGGGYFFFIYFNLLNRFMYVHVYIYACMCMFYFICICICIYGVYIFVCIYLGNCVYKRACMSFHILCWSYSISYTYKKRKKNQNKLWRIDKRIVLRIYKRLKTRKIRKYQENLKTQSSKKTDIELFP